MNKASIAQSRSNVTELPNLPERDPQWDVKALRALRELEGPLNDLRRACDITAELVTATLDESQLTLLEEGFNDHKISCRQAENAKFIAYQAYEMAQNLLTQFYAAVEK